MRQPNEADRIERDLGAVAGISDRGLRHPRNEDALAVRVIGPAVCAAVCDGVSTSDSPAEAARLAATTTCDLLATAVQACADPAGATEAAVIAAGKAVSGLAEDTAENPDRAPACTCVCALVTDETITVGWVGDSRAYWLATGPGNGTSDVLTVDDSWATAMVATGRLTAQQAAADPRAHALTRWLGADAEPDQPSPHVTTLRPAGPGVLLLCSDGLWNYCPNPNDLADMITPAALSKPLDAAKTLVQYALRCGGQDNVTVVVVPFPPAIRRTETP